MELKGNAPGDKVYKHNNCSHSFAYVYYGNAFDNKILQSIETYDLLLPWNVCSTYRDYKTSNTTHISKIKFDNF